jgi:hypothetical protein
VKDVTTSIAGVLLIALVIGLVFHWVYPRVDLTSELTSLFLFVAVLAKLAITKLWSLRRKPHATQPPASPPPTSSPPSHEAEADK